MNEILVKHYHLRNSKKSLMFEQKLRVSLIWSTVSIWVPCIFLNKHIFILLFQTCLQCPVIQCQFTKYEKSAEAFWLQWFNLFAFYWSMNFVTAFGELVLAGVFATWYWTWDKSTVPCCVLGTSMVYAIFFHLVRF